jgi:hypothetical protein
LPIWTLRSNGSSSVWITREDDERQFLNFSFSSEVVQRVWVRTRMGWTCRMRPILEAHQSALDMTQEWLRKGQNPRGYAFEVMTGAGEVVFKVPLAEALDRQVGTDLSTCPEL